MKIKKHSVSVDLFLVWNGWSCSDLICCFVQVKFHFIFLLLQYSHSPPSQTQHWAHQQKKGFCLQIFQTLRFIGRTIEVLSVGKWKQKCRILIKLNNYFGIIFIMVKVERETIPHSRPDGQQFIYKKSLTYFCQTSNVWFVQITRSAN